MFTSCADMLETSSELVEFEKDNTLNHPTDSLYSVMGVINRLQTIADRSVLLGEVRSDLVTTTPAANADLKRLAAFDFSQSNKYNQVSDYYAVINNCNYFLAHIDTAMQRRGRVLFMREYAAVKAFRAWTYLELVKAYGHVPLVTEPLMTEQQASKAMNQAKQDITAVCNYFIEDLSPYAKVENPEYGAINNYNSKEYFIPKQALLGDLCLWAGRYKEAASWYNSYLNDPKNPMPLRTGNRVTWGSPTEFISPRDNYSAVREAISYIPMESIVFNGVVSDLDNIFESTRENRYYYQVTPSAGMRQLSAAQTYCMEYKTSSETDTIYVPHTGFSDDRFVGDLRFYSNYRRSSLGGQDPYSEYNSLYQSISKYSNLEVGIMTYRTPMVYLRYAEALNRAGLPQSAMLILKYGMCQENIVSYVDSLERAQAGGLITFDDEVFLRENTIGIHAYGSGDVQCDTTYVLPQPAGALATREDTVAYQIPLVEDLIISEMALEGAFEGYRYYDLMRVALRRGTPDYLAAPISRRSGTEDAALRTFLMDPKNWYLPLP